MQRPIYHEGSEQQRRTFFLVVFIVLVVAIAVNTAFLYLGWRGFVQMSLLSAGKLFLVELILVLLARLVWEFFDGAREACQKLQGEVNG